MIEKFLTTEQVANILQVHPFTILKFIKQGKLPGIKLGRVYRIKESDVKEFLDRSASKVKQSVVKPVESIPPPPKQEEKGSTDSDLKKDPNPYQINKDNDNQQHYYII